MRNGTTNQGTTVSSVLANKASPLCAFTQKSDCRVGLGFWLAVTSQQLGTTDVCNDAVSIVGVS